MFEKDKADMRAAHPRRVGLRATDVIRWAAEHYWGEDGSRGSDETTLEWMRLGGDAHALGWQLLIQDTQWTAGEQGPGPTQVNVAGTLVNVAQPYLCAWSLFKAALRCFDELGTPPSSATT